MELKKDYLLTKEKRIVLYNKYKTEGDIESRNRLIESVIPVLLKEIGNRVHYTKIDDTLQRTIEVLINRFDNYNPEYALTRYAVWMLRSELSYNFKKDSKFVKVEHPDLTLTQILGYHGISEVQEETPEGEIDENNYLTLINNVVKSKKQRDALLDYLHGETYSSIALEQGITKEAARVRIKKAIGKIKDTISRNGGLYNKEV